MLNVNKTTEASHTSFICFYSRWLGLDLNKFVTVGPLYKLGISGTRPLVLVVFWFWFKGASVLKKNKRYKKKNFCWRDTMSAKATF